MFGLTLLLDLVIFSSCIAILLKSGRITFVHPGTIYLFYHFISITLRGWLLFTGSPLLFSDQVSWALGWEPVTFDEIIRAVLVADVALLAITAACLAAAQRERTSQPRFKDRPRKIILLEDTRVQTVAIIVFIVGILGILLGSKLPGISIEQLDLGAWDSSTWISMLQTWPSVVLVILIYRYGFRKSLVFLMTITLFLMLYQGYHRFRVVIPVLMLIQYYVESRGMNWPPKSVWVLLVILGIAWIPMKAIGKMLQEGSSIEDIVNRSTEIVSGLQTNSFSDLTFLDQFASVLTLEDQHGEFYYGKTYIPILALPIPRPWWPDKPPLNFHTIEISTPSRPMARLGMIVTLVGESYINFGYLGVVLVPFILLYALSRFYFAARRRDIYSITRTAYILTAAGLILVYRDGLPSLVLFTFVNYMPIILILGLHIIFPPRKNIYQLEQPNSLTFKKLLQTNDGTSQR